MGTVMPTTRKVVVEIELPEGVSLDQILRGVKYRVVEKRGLRELIKHARTVQPKPEAPREEPSLLLEKERR